MTVSRRTRGRTPGWVRGLLLFSLIIAWAVMSPAPASAGQAASAPKAGYVGIAACTREACHVKQATAYLTGPHGSKSNAEAPGATDECESCHGPGQPHMDNPKEAGKTRNFAKMVAREANAVCLECHEQGEQANFGESMHARRNVTCVSCHSQHSAQSTKGLLKTRFDADTCFTCHKSERAKSMRTSHHPIREGKMGCGSCHNPHDGSRPKQLRADSVNEVCYTCHTEKRGPFLYEHGAVREDCVSCHDPHGSNHARMLQAKQPFLCQRCHNGGHGANLYPDFNVTQIGGLPVAPASPPGAVNAAGTVIAQVARSSRAMERSCISCHLTIHGSNSASGQFFVR